MGFRKRTAPEPLVVSPSLRNGTTVPGKLRSRGQLRPNTAGRKFLMAVKKLRP